MSKACRAVFWLYLLLCLLALLVIPASEAGLFGLTPDPLAAVFAVLLAQPWLSLVSAVVGDTGLAASVAMTLAGMVLNAALLRAVCNLLARRRRARQEKLSP